MRNWNPHPEYSNLLLLLRFEPTYEELKLVSPISFHLLICWDLSLPMRNWNWFQFWNPQLRRLKIWAYLWGIETCYGAIFGENTILDLSLPMRNWNSFSIFFFKNSFLRFEPTYEELKRGHWYGTRCPRCGFEPTYEELKLNRFIHQHLKLRFDLSLPMRNWNLNK